MGNSCNHLYKFDSFVLDSMNRRLMKHEELVPLPSRSFDLLLVLLQNSGRLMGKDELMNAVWQDATVEEANLAVNISALRKALGEVSNERRYIITVPGRGYKFLADVIRSMEKPNACLPDEVGKPTIDEEALAEVETIAEAPKVQVVSDAAGVSKQRRIYGSLIVVIVLLVSTLILFFSFRDNYKQHASGLPMKVSPFTSMQGIEMEPAFSPDNKQVAFVRNGEAPLTGSNGVYVKLFNSDVPLKITNKPGEYFSPVWSSDGRFVAYTRLLEEDKGIYMVSALGDAERKLISGTWEDGCSAQIDWSPDGRFIAFTERQKDDERQSYCIYLLSLETLEKTQITFPSAPGIGDRFPMFSPDGKMIAFAKVSTEGTGIFLVSSTGGNVKQLLFEKKSILGLTWTADGDLIFSSNRDGTRSLWRISADGGQPEKQTFGTEGVAYPAISRQGDLLAYDQSNEDSNIWRLELGKAEGKGRKARQIISSTRRDADVDISPDSKRIAYESNRSGKSEIWICNSDGSDNLPLIDFAGASMHCPRWSPDGRHIAFQSYNGEQIDIYVVDVNGGRPRRLTSGAANESVPTWSRDGKMIYFSSKLGGLEQLWKIPAEGGMAIKLTDNGAINALESVDGQMLYHANRSDAGLWQLPVNGGTATRLLEFPERGFWAYWAVVEKGIYYIRSDGKNHFMIEFFDFATRKSTLIAPLEKIPSPWEKGFAVSADGNWLLYSQLDQNNSDIMVVENFR
jgi:Tol biopolymer transport system component/DNA-binding winged helix-turn-helix (wHTH) protein